MIEIKTELTDIREVDGSELNALCESGWQLICILQEKTVGVEVMEVPCPGPTKEKPCSHGAWWGTECYRLNRQPVIGERQTTKYVVGQGPDNALGQLKQQVWKFQAELQEERTAHAATATAHKETQKALAEAELAKDHATTHADQLVKDLHTERCTTLTRNKEISQLEGQIKKLRAEFGEREVRRVLEE